MPKLKLDISMSLDGFVAGPDPSLEDPLGVGGEQLHEWAFGLKAFREPHGLPGGDEGPDSELIDEAIRSTGATIMGRKMFSGGSGPWKDDPNADGWWGDDPPFKHPVFVLTHHPRETVAKQGGTTFTFVTDGIESALEQARATAGDQDVAIGGGAEAAQQYLYTGLLDEVQIHLVPVLLGGGVPLFGSEPRPERPKLESTRVAEGAGVTHLGYRVVK